MEGKQLIELAYDVQSGLGSIDVPDFDQMRTMGMAATLAIHIRGLGELDYEVLRKVSDHYFNIPSFRHFRECLWFFHKNTSQKQVNNIVVFPSLSNLLQVFFSLSFENPLFTLN